MPQCSIYPFYRTIVSCKVNGSMWVGGGNGVGESWCGIVPVFEASSRCASIRMIVGNTIRVSCLFLDVLPTNDMC